MCDRIVGVAWRRLRPPECRWCLAADDSWMNFPLRISGKGRGLHDITQDVEGAVRASGVASGLATMFIKHTSASLVIQENTDPAVMQDLQDWIDRAVPEFGPKANYLHNSEGPDDMPAHIRAAITATSLSVPILDGRLELGTWQGIFLWEHRRRPRTRTVVVHIA